MFIPSFQTEGQVAIGCELKNGLKSWAQSHEAEVPFGFTASGFGKTAWEIEAKLWFEYFKARGAQEPDDAMYLLAVGQYDGSRFKPDQILRLDKNLQRIPN